PCRVQRRFGLRLRLVKTVDRRSGRVSGNASDRAIETVDVVAELVTDPQQTLIPGRHDQRIARTHRAMQRGFQGCEKWIGLHLREMEAIDEEDDRSRLLGWWLACCVGVVAGAPARLPRILREIRDGLTLP